MPNYVNGLVSVIMGIYNCAETLPQAIDSIIAQTYEDWELIMCDDASTDNTYEVAKAYSEKYPEKIVLIQNDKNSKLSYSLNHCLKYARGEYVARMDGDDYCSPQRFEKQIKYLKEHPDVDLVGTSMQSFNDKGYGAVFCKTDFPDKYTLKSGIPFNHATIMTYKKVFDTVNGYTVSERTARCEDYDLWFRFFYAGFKGGNISELLYFVREDEAAFKRRTIRGRWNGFKSTCVGYQLLDFPKRWLIKPFFIMVIKIVTPKKVFMIHHSKNR